MVEKWSSQPKTETLKKHLHVQTLQARNITALFHVR